MSPSPADRPAWLDAVRTVPLLADGAMGTMLQAAGLPPGAPPELWNLERPEAVLRVHSSYLEAGARLILTNSFGANPIKLASAGLPDRTQEINQQAVRLARRAGEGLVGASVGPTGQLLSPLGELEPETALAAFRRQCQALTEADLIVLETFYALEEIELALQAALETGLPAVACMTFQEGRTVMGTNPTQAATRLAEAGAAAVGANCGTGPAEMAPVVLEMRRATGLPLWAKPNAGRAQLVGGEVHYPEAPSRMAEQVLRLVELGANVVGGCCGSTPGHIGAIAQALFGRR